MAKFITLLFILLGFSGCYLPVEGAAEDPGANSDTTGQDDMARRKLENHTQQDVPHGHVVPATAPVIPSNGSWSGNNQLGNEVPFAPDSNNRQTVLKLDEWGPPEIWTVSLYMVNGLADFGSFNVQAHIEFGSGGTTQIETVDWVNGMQISLPMNAVNVIAEYKQVDVTDAGRGIRLGVQLSRGRRGGSQPPVLTLSDELFVGSMTTSAPIEIPKFATRIKFMPTLPGDTTAFSANTTYFIVSGNNGASFNVQAITGDKLLANDGLEVFGASRFIRINNNDAALNVRVVVYAELEG